jgi:hypothetical protein
MPILPQSSVRRKDRHSQQHQAEQRNCLVLQILQRRALQHDGADDARSIF